MNFFKLHKSLFFDSTMISESAIWPNFKVMVVLVTSGWGHGFVFEEAPRLSEKLGWLYSFLDMLLPAEWSPLFLSREFPSRGGQLVLVIPVIMSLVQSWRKTRSTRSGKGTILKVCCLLGGLNLVQGYFQVWKASSHVIPWNFAQLSQTQEQTSKIKNKIRGSVGPRRLAVIWIQIVALRESHVKSIALTVICYNECLLQCLYVPGDA